MHNFAATIVGELGKFDHMNHILCELSHFSTWRICSRERKIQERNWLAKTFSLANHITKDLFSLLFARRNSPGRKPALRRVLAKNQFYIGS